MPNKVTIEIRQLALELVSSPEYRETFRQRLLKGKLAPAVEAMLYYYAFGKPKEEVDLSVNARDDEILARLAAGRQRVAMAAKTALTNASSPDAPVVPPQPLSES